MKTKSKFLLLTLVLLLVGLTTVSASDNISDTYENTGIVLENEITAGEVIHEISTDSNVRQINNDNNIEKNEQEKLLKKIIMI